MARVIIGYVIGDFSPIQRFIRFVENPTGGTASGFRKAAFRYKRFLTKRFIRFSRGGGGWLSLTESTVESKKRRGIASNPRAILRESDEILQSITVRRVGATYQVGIFDEGPHPHSSLSVTRLAEVHQTAAYPRARGERRIVVLPDQPTRVGMVQDIQESANKAAQKANRGTGRGR